MSKKRSQAIMTDSLTILICGEAFSASKQITLDDMQKVKINPFSAGKFFGLITHEVADIQALSGYLLALETMPKAFVIRGSPIMPIDTKLSFRRTKENFSTPPEGKRWVMLDFDKITLPPTLDPATDPESVMDHLVAQLPNEFHDVTYHYQLSSSSGFTASGTVSAHLWFWLSSPCTDANLKRWCKSVNGSAKCKLVDPALFNDVQAHYTAAPVFEGVTDPFPLRSGLVTKSNNAVNIRIIDAPMPSSMLASGFIEMGPGFEGFLGLIGDQAGGEGFHEPIIRAIASYVSTHGRAGTDQEALYETLRIRIQDADRSHHAKSYVEHMASREHIMPAIAGAIEKYGDQGDSRRRSRVIEGGTPPPTKEYLSATDAYRTLSSALDEIMLPPSP